MSQDAKPVTIIMVEDDQGHARLIEKNIRRAGVNNELIAFVGRGIIYKCFELFRRRDASSQIQVHAAAKFIIVRERRSRDVVALHCTE